MIKYQQGDVIIKQLESPIEEQTENYDGGLNDMSEKSDRWIQDHRTVIAEGEVTGHAHAFNDTNNPGVNINLFKLQNTWNNPQRDSDTPHLMRIAGGDAVLTHEEHNAITIPVGEYEIYQVREFDYLRRETRRVVD